MPRPARVALICLAPIAAAATAAAQPTRDVGLPPPFDTPALPPAVNPALPPPTGQRYLPGTGGPFSDPDYVPPPQRTPRAGMDSYRSNIRRSQPGGKPASLAQLRDLAPYLRACWTPPALEASGAPLDATIRFSLRRDGAVDGQARITYVNARATSQQRSAIVASLNNAIAGCTPMPLTPSFGAAIAGRPLSIRFILDAAPRS
ncbi:MAG: hypothetical protein ABWZ80_08240 [Beijerinckiaceae bacterium]